MRKVMNRVLVVGIVLTVVYLFVEYYLPLLVKQIWKAGVWRETAEGRKRRGNAGCRAIYNYARKPSLTNSLQTFRLYLVLCDLIFSCTGFQIFPFHSPVSAGLYPDLEILISSLLKDMQLHKKAVCSRAGEDPQTGYRCPMLEEIISALYQSQTSRLSWRSVHLNN